MQKELNQMTPEELGQLFPIVLFDPNPYWGRLFEIEKKNIERTMGSNNLIKIEHIGSTAIPNLISKPTIDILIEVPEESDDQQIIDKMISLGYYFIPRLENPAPHMMFCKGYSKEGYEGQAYHIHVRYSGDWDEIYFRDYLRQYPQIALEYSKLKQDLINQYRNDREGYTNGKSDFINRITRIAKNKC